jgi:predicted Rossmann fold nucleotide-binding protein DprA/Smf involved in DNA uptake
MVLHQLEQGTVHPDTQAILLLCGTFAKGSGSDAKPLTLAEYNALASWLGRHGRRPASLLSTSEDPFPPEEPSLPPLERVRALLSRGFQMAAAVEGWQRLGLWVISRGEQQYPERLRRHLRSAAPPLLFGAGDIQRLNRGGLAVVGSRDIDEDGLSFTRRIAERCATQGIQIISGGARGVDRAAVAAVLESGGEAVAVLAERLDRIATSRDAKEPLRDGRLTLLTPYEPEAGFTVGRAMGRNRDIYGLADAALIVRFTTKEGGTWAGAIEQLSRNKSASPCIPVFVRLTDNPEDGCEELRRRGAVPFPEEEFWKDGLVELLMRTAPPADRIPAAASGDAASVQTATEANAVAAAEPASGSQTAESLPPPSSEPRKQTDTCYDRCLPLLLQSFRAEVGVKQLSEIARRLQLLPKQLEEWVKRAIEEGKLAKKTKKRRRVYVAVSTSDEQGLFGRDGDAA